MSSWRRETRDNVGITVFNASGTLFWNYIFLNSDNLAKHDYKGKVILAILSFLHCVSSETTKTTVMLCRAVTGNRLHCTGTRVSYFLDNLLKNPPTLRTPPRLLLWYPYKIHFELRCITPQYWPMHSVSPCSWRSYMTNLEKKGHK